MICKSMLTRLLFLMISIALATSVFADLALGPNPPLPPSIQMSKPENNPMQDIMAGILMTCAMMTSGYLIIRRKGFTFSRCIGIVIFLWTISTISLAASFWYLTNSHQREYQRFQRSVEKLRSLNPDKVPVDNSDEP
jgi:hypothetical protein